MTLTWFLLLPDRPLTSEERAAHDEDPRPGVWAGQLSCDLREFSQDETDALIRRELLDSVVIADHDQIRSLVGAPAVVDTGRVAGVNPWARCQRGGIDSDPLVRLLAYRAWGDRDRRWFGGGSRG